MGGKKEKQGSSGVKNLEENLLLVSQSVQWNIFNVLHFLLWCLPRLTKVTCKGEESFKILSVLEIANTSYNNSRQVRTFMLFSFFPFLLLILEGRLKQKIASNREKQ